MRTCNITKDGVRTGKQVVCCAPGKRCVPVSYKNAQDQLEGMGYWCSLPDACPVCWLPQGQFCCCHDLCKNCLRSSFRDCQIKGCVLPGKAYPDEGAKVSRGHVKVWIDANKEILKDYQNRRRSRCNTCPSYTGTCRRCGRPGPSPCEETMAPNHRGPSKNIIQRLVEVSAGGPSTPAPRRGRR